ncbi:MAG TPA: glycoside hydrolase family 20 zincin-like fold domain-containing protein, partial [Streptosporangiaceae bacterium]
MDDRLAGLLPRPVSVRPLPGQFSLTRPLLVVAAPGASAAAAVVSRTLGWLPWPQEPPPGESGQSGGEIAVGLAADLPAEGYRLRV